MGAFSVVLDPAGYNRVDEQGFMGQWTGADLWAKSIRGDNVVVDTSRNSLWNPPGSDWLMLRPLQLCQEFLAPNEAPGHNLSTYRIDEYTFAGGVNPTEFDMDRKPGSLRNLNPDVWLTFRTPDSITSLDSCNYAAMFQKVGVAKPFGIQTIAFLANTPKKQIGPQPLVDGDYTPCFRWIGQPWPDSSFVFGFAVFACIVTNETVYVLKTDDGKQSWKLIGQAKRGDSPSPMRPQSELRGTSASMMSGPAINNTPHDITVIPVGADALYFYCGSTEPLRITVRDVQSSLDDDRLFDGGTWWIGLPPGQKFTCQTQCVSYDYSFGAGNHLGMQFFPTGNEPLFDLGENYKPTVEFTQKIHYRMQFFQGIATLETGDPPDQRSITATGGQQILVQLVDEDSLGFPSDGTREKGFLSVALNPGNNSSINEDIVCFLAPQVRGYQLRFPPLLTPRTNSAKTLTDLQVKEWRVEGSLHDPDAKRLEIVLTPEASNTLIGAGNWAERDDYPVHIVESGTVRAAGWVESVDLEEIYTEDPDSATRTIPLRQYKITAKGLLSRADVGWVYIPQLVDPEGDGYIEHSWIVETVLNSCGFDIEDSAIYLAATDPLAGTGAAQLPGTWGATTGTNGQQDEGAFNPDYAQTKLKYLIDLTRDFRGWLLYETMAGLIRYHPDPALWFGTGGRRYYVAATIYRTQAEATAAGVTGQYMLAQPTRTMVKPVSNHIRISGQGDDAETFPHVIDSAPETLTDLTDPDFVGDWKPTAYPLKLAVEEGKALQLARVALLLSKHRGEIRHVAVPLAPWQFGPTAVAPGEVVTLQGRGDYWVHGMEVFCQRRDQYVTRLSVEKIRTGNTATASGSCTGGTPWPGACLVS